MCLKNKNQWLDVAYIKFNQFGHNIQQKEGEYKTTN
jgi:hypothetical protein